MATIRTYVSYSKGVVSYLAPDEGESLFKVIGTVSASNYLGLPPTVYSGSIFSGSASGTFSGSIVGIANSTRYEFHDHSGSQLIPEYPAYAAVQCNSILDNINGGILLWNSNSNKIQPDSIGSVYSVRLTGKTIPIDGGGNGVIHVYFTVSGASIDINRHLQEFEVSIRPNSSHAHILANYTFFTDNILFTSGAQIYFSTTNAGGITLSSCSLFIKEG